jgi:predicted nucleic acid-binding protein
MADLVDKHADFPLGGVDASVMAIADRLGVDIVAAIDHRHFHAARRRGTERSLN